jgi:hypothetical protein
MTQVIFALLVTKRPQITSTVTTATDLRIAIVEPTVPNARLKILARHAAPDTTRLSTAGATAVLRDAPTAKMPPTAVHVTKTTSF